MGQQWTSDLGLRVTGPERGPQPGLKQGGRAAEGGQSTRPQQGAADPTQTKRCARGPLTRQGVELQEAPAPRRGLPTARRRPALAQDTRRGSGSLQGRPRRWARDHRARERAPGGTRKRRAPARARLGLQATRAVGPPRASGARAPPWAPARGESSAGACHPGPGPSAGDDARVTRPRRERASGRASQRAGRRLPLAPRGRAR